MTYRLRVLIAKDLRLHGKSVAFLLLALCALFEAMFRFGPPEMRTDSSLVLNLNAMAVLALGEWFINREKTKQTFAWLRTLPLSATDLCVSKFGLVGGFTIVIWHVTSLLFLRGQFFPHAWAAWCAIQAGLLLFGGVVVACRWRFRHKLGQVLGPLLLAPVAFVVLAAIEWEVTRSLVLRLGTTTGGQLGLSAALLAAYLAVGWLTWRWVKTSETREMLE